MEKINLREICDRNYYGVPKDIAKTIVDKGHSLWFSGFDTYTERDENENVVITFHYNEFDYYRQGLLDTKRE